MDGARSGRSRRALFSALLAAVAAGGWLFAQTPERGAASQSLAETSTQAATTQPSATSPGQTSAQTAEGTAATQVGETTSAAAGETTVAGRAQRAQQTARERLISGLIGSKHDFTEVGKDGRDLCLPCHTPHLVGARPPRLDRRAEVAAPLRPYQDLNVELDGWSLLCLGCHDGVTAPDVYSSSHATAVASQLGSSRLGTRGLRSHPVGIKYPAPSEDYEPRAAVEAAGLLLPDGRIQCSTCHDAHNTSGHAGMLRISNDRSRVCVTCHRL